MGTKWILPINPKQFDILDYLKQKNEFAWKAKKHFREGDAVYIYATKPTQEIRYCCTCTKEKANEDDLLANSYALQKDVNRYAMFKVIKKSPDGLFPWSELHANGMGQALLPTKVYSDLEAFMHKKEEEV